MKKAVFLSLITLFSVPVLFAQNNTNKLDLDYVVFTLRKTECKGTCPAYNMEIYKSGKVLFEGTKHIEKLENIKKKYLLIWLIV